MISTHPRTKDRLNKLDVVFHTKLRFVKAMGYFDYNRLQIAARAVLSDSGTITEDASILNFPALNLRDSHERPEGMEEGAVMMVGLNPDRIFQALTILDDQPRGSLRWSNIVESYNVESVSSKILRIIHSYTDYTNQNVWRKN